jgi:hypothetical protein
VPETKSNPFYGPDDTEYLREVAAKKQEAKQQKLLTGPPKERLKNLDPNIINYEPRNVGDVKILEEIAKRQALPRPVTVTAKNPRIPTTAAAKRRLFQNLQRQLRQEIDKATVIGTFEQMDIELRKDAIEFASRSIELWKDIESEEVKMEVLEIELNDLEPRVREIVKELIGRRLGLERQLEDEKYRREYGEESEEELEGGNDGEREKEAFDKNEKETFAEIEMETVDEKEADSNERSNQESDGNDDEEFARRFANICG